MQVSSLPTESEIDNQKNIQIEQTCIKMNIYDPPDMNNNVNQEESNGDINQTQETLVVNNNINQLSLEKLEFNTHNYPLTENRNISPAPLTVEKRVMIFNSVNMITNYPKQGNIIDNQNTQQNIENNAITIPTTINDPSDQEVTKENSESNDTCRYVLLIILCLILLPLFILYLLIICLCSETKEKKDSDCIPC